MYLKISTTSGSIFEGEVHKIIADTEVGEVSILPDHFPIISVLRPGLVKIYPQDKTISHLVEDFIPLSLSKGLLYVNKNNILIVSSIATMSIDENESILEKIKEDLEEKLAQVQVEGDIEHIEKTVLSLEKVKADLRLLHLKES